MYLGIFCFTKKDILNFFPLKTFKLQKICIKQQQYFKFNIAKEKHILIIYTNKLRHLWFTTTFNCGQKMNFMHIKNVSE